MIDLATADLPEAIATAARRAADAVDRDWMVALLTRAVATPSVTGTESAIADLLADALREAGVDDVRTFEFAPGRRNVWGRLAGAGHGPSLLLAGHTDTVTVGDWRAAWRGTSREDPFGAVIEDGALHGRGAADMKAGVVCSIAAVKAVIDSGARPAGDVLFAFVGDEESGEPGSGYSDGIRDIADRMARDELPRADLAIYSEPTNLDVFVAQMGFVLVDVTVHGETSYFGKPWLGIDAIRGAHGLLEDLWAYDATVSRHPGHRLLGRPFNLVTGISGGGLIAVPGECRISMIRKVIPGESLDDIREEFEELFRSSGTRRRLRLSWEYTTHRDHAIGGTPGEVDEALPAVRRLAALVRSETGRSDVVGGAPYSSEAAFLHAIGTPTVYLGPGDIITCHTPNENVPLDDCTAAARIFAATIVSHCAASEPPGADGDVATAATPPLAARDRS